MTETFDKGIFIDGTFYDVPLITCKRKADFLWKSADRTEDGEHVGELLGVFLNYSLSFGDIHDRNEYNRLYLKLTEEVEYHEICMPSADGSMFKFKAYFASVQDEIAKSKNGYNKFKGLQVEFTSKKPNR